MEHSENNLGFTKNKSIESELFDYPNEVLKILVITEIPVGMFLHLSKAYDSMDCNILLEKLKMVWDRFHGSG